MRLPRFAVVSRNLRAKNDGYAVNLDKGILENAPSYHTSDVPDWSSPTYRSGIDDYYHVRLADVGLISGETPERFGAFLLHEGGVVRTDIRPMRGTV